MQSNQHDKTGGLGRYASHLTILLLTGALLVAATPAAGQAEPRTFDDDENPCGCGVEYMLSTGAENGYTPDAFGDQDQHWRSVTVPGGVPAPNVHSIPPVWGIWDTTGGANWINPWSGGNNNYGASVGTYVYEIEFQLDLASYTNFQLDILVGTDQSAGQVFLNGDLVGITTSFRSLTPMSADSQTHTFLANNVLRVETVNTGGPTGMILEGGITGECFWNDEGELTIDVSTGTDNGIVQGYGDLDPDWTTLSTPGNNTTGGAYSIEAHSFWANFNDANWINAYNEQIHPGVYVPTPQNNRYDAPAGLYEYQLKFYLPHDAIDYLLEFDYAADNGVQFYLNGFPIGGTPAPAAGLPPGASISEADQTKFIAGGLNTLTAVVTNDGDWTGFIVSGEMTTNCECHHEHDDPLGGSGPDLPWEHELPFCPVIGGCPFDPADGIPFDIPGDGGIVAYNPDEPVVPGTSVPVDQIPHEVSHQILGDH